MEAGSSPPRTPGRSARPARAPDAVPGRRAPVRDDPRARVVAAVVTALLVVVLLVLVVRGCTGDEAAVPPASAAAGLVPANALVYVDLSTDTGRPATKQALRIARRFPGYPAQRDSIVRRLTAPGAKGDVRRWAGDEAALALLPGTEGTAQSLVVVRIKDRAGATRYVTGGRSPAGVSRYRQVPLYPAGGVVTAIVGDFVVVGQENAVRQALDLRAKEGRPLSADPTYVRAIAPLPADRVVTGWATVEGVRRILAPQSGLLGAAGTLLDRQGLIGAGLALSPRPGGARLVVHSIVDPKAAGPSATFTPTLQEKVPKDAILSLGVRGLNTALGRLLGVAPGVGNLGPLLTRASAALAAKSGGALRSGLLGLLGQEAVVAVTPALPAPTLTLMTKTGDEAKTGRAMAALRPTVAGVLAQKNTAGTRVAPTWKRRSVDGVTAWSLPFAAGAELDYAVFDGLLVVSTKLAGLRAVKNPDGNVTETEKWQAVVRNHPNPVSSLVFLDFNQLLRLGEQTGLNDSRAYQKVRDDLQRITAVGLTSKPGKGESTAEIELQIP